MKNRFVILLGLVNCCAANIIAQVSDQFSDGNLSSDPAWVGDLPAWTVNSSFQLQSANNTVNSSFYLSTPNALSADAQWEFWCNLAFNTSSLNYVDVYLTASHNNLKDAMITGYFLRIGGSNDEVSLYRKDLAGNAAIIINGTDGTLNSSNNLFKIKVIRDASFQWTLFLDQTGTGNNYVFEGSATDGTYSSSVAMGIIVHQSSSSFFQKHFFDDIEVKTYVPDTSPPVISSVAVVSSMAIDVLFSEAVTAGSSGQVTNYLVNNNLGHPSSAARDAADSRLVHLGFASAFPNGVNCTLQVNGVRDLAGNEISSGSIAFSYYSASRFDIVIHEIMADPSPAVGLPNYEWIELKNTSLFPINIGGWRIGDVSGMSGAIPGFVLQPDSLVIICGAAAGSSMNSFGRTLVVNGFPSLDNESDLILLKNAAGNTIHAVRYHLAWYENELKKNGGWTLEMIDALNPCDGNKNWNASTALVGGTPGSRNSIESQNSDKDAPRLLKVYPVDATRIMLVFNEPLDSLVAINPGILSVDGAIIDRLELSPPFDRLEMFMASPIEPNKIYTITCSRIIDCSGNEMPEAKGRFGLPADPLENELVINEVLFNPRSGAYDFIEVYNSSEKIFDASRFFIGNRTTGGLVGSITAASIEPLLVFPGDYLVMTEDAANLSMNYLVKSPEMVSEIRAMPSLPDDEGDAVLLNAQGDIVDEVKYSGDWHFKLIDNADGVSLERIDPRAPSGEKANWHSAASAAGFATPTYQNSQFRLAASPAGAIDISPKVFSPDNDGFDDFALIRYKMTETGYAGNVTIFDAAGRPVRLLVRNDILGLAGSWNWDGLNDKGLKLPAGAYIVLTEIFNLRGKKERFRNVVVLAGRVN